MHEPYGLVKCIFIFQHDKGCLGRSFKAKNLIANGSVSVLDVTLIEKPYKNTALAKIVSHG